MPTCPFCNKNVALDAVFCRECGKSLKDVVKCLKCGSALSKGAKFCNKCGAPAPKTCPQCGGTLVLGAKFCNKCGSSLPSTFWLDANICLKCNAPLKPGAMFCSKCGASCEQAKAEAALSVEEDASSVEVPSGDDKSAIVDAWLKKYNINDDITKNPESTQQMPPQPEKEPEPQLAGINAQIAATISQNNENIVAVEEKKNGTKKKKLILLGVVTVAIGIVAVIFWGGGFGESADKTMLVDSRDGQKYRTVIIGSQTWMAENLNFKTDERSWCYNDNATNCDKYGRLYTWYVAMHACPSGWHLPKKTEFENLFSAVGGQSTAGTMLKSTSGWDNSGNGTDAYGFSALPAGYRDNEGYFGTLGSSARFWSSTDDYYSNNAYYLFLHSRHEHGYLDDYYKDYGRSVRCVKDSQ